VLGNQSKDIAFIYLIIYLIVCFSSELMLLLCIYVHFQMCQGGGTAVYVGVGGGGKRGLVEGGRTSKIPANSGRLTAGKGTVSFLTAFTEWQRVSQIHLQKDNHQYSALADRSCAYSNSEI